MYQLSFVNVDTSLCRPTAFREVDWNAFKRILIVITDDCDKICNHLETAQDVHSTSETQPLAEDQKGRHRQEHPPTPSSSAFTSAKDCHSKTKPPQLSDAQPKDILNWIKCNTNHPDEYPKGMRVLSRQHINYITNSCGDHVILGSGSYGVVFLCRLVETGTPCGAQADEGILAIHQRGYKRV